MKLSSALVKIGLILTAVGLFIARSIPSIALFLADAGDYISAFGMRLHCYGH